MQEKNILAMEYFHNPERLADLLNGFHFQGRKLVIPANVQEKAEIVSRSDVTSPKKVSHFFIHDAVRQITIETNVVLIALENQDRIHYAMPIRAINGDACEYWRQWKQIKLQHRQKKDLKSNDEFLSGFSPTDFLTAITTLVIYWGKKTWNGPRTLKEILNIQNASQEIQNLFFDYSFHLLDVRRFPHIEYFRTDLQWVFGFLQNSEDKKKLSEYVNTHVKEFENLAEDAYDLLCVMADSRILKKLKNKYQEHKGGVNMCKALQDMIDEGKRLGRLEGRKQGRKQGMKHGMQQGMKQGMQQGMKQGMQQGMQQGMKQGTKQGLQQGIELSRKVFSLYYKRCSYEYIAAQCNISVNKVKYILGHTAA